jgi:hypothetical protein
VILSELCDDEVHPIGFSELRLRLHFLMANAATDATCASKSIGTLRTCRPTEARSRIACNDPRSHSSPRREVIPGAKYGAIESCFTLN